MALSPRSEGLALQGRVGVKCLLGLPQASNSKRQAAAGAKQGGRLPFGAIVAIVVDRRSIDPTSSNLIMLILPYSDGADGALVMVMPFLKSLYNPFINP